MSLFFENLLSPHLSGFRKAHDCQSVLLRLIETCKTSLDKNYIYGALLTDLSKAFDCLPHKLLIAKMKAYGFDTQSCLLVASYFNERKQRVKVSGMKSEWLNILKGAPQGSLFGPFAYNVHSNDLLYLINESCDVYNYADDNTVGCSGNDNVEVMNKLSHVSNIMIQWFQNNLMKANPDKFQLIVFNPRSTNIPSLTISGNVIQSQPIVKLLGVNLDIKLNFSNHIHEICQKAGRKVNVLSRLCRTLDVKGKSMLFNAFVLSQFNFCPTVWHHCSIKDMKKIERIQFRALRFIHNDFTSTYAELRGKSDRPLLYVERLRVIATEVYKCINKMNPTYLHDMFYVKDQAYAMRNTNVNLPKYNTVRYGKLSIKYEGASLWNSLDHNVKASMSLKMFKENIAKWNGPKCACSYCNICVISHI